MAMNPELKAKWVAALRSGKYEQMRYQLYDRPDSPTRLCCIGVGIAAQGCPHEGWGTFDTPRAANLLGLPYDDQRTLIVMNDDENKSFPEIADYIEKNL